MLRAVSVVLQTILFLIVNVLALFIPHGSHLQTVYSHSANVTHLFIWDGILAMLIAYLVILLIEAVCKRIMQWSGLTTLALVLAIVLGVLPPLHLGFMTL